MMIELGGFAIAATLASGSLVGLLLALFGGGGSVLAAPLLLYAVGVPSPHVAIGTGSAAVAANAAFNLVGHWRGGRVKWPCAITFAVSGLIGSLAGSSFAKMVDGQHLLIAFAIAMAAIGASMLRRPKSEGDPDVHLNAKMMLRLAPLGLLTGLAAGFFGIGGGFLIVPALIFATGMPVISAVGSSLLAVGTFGLATALNSARAGFVDWEVAGLFIVGGLAGGVVGMLLATRLSASKTALNRIFSVLVLSVAAYVIFRNLPSFG
jgi:uncharacterized membrane protein YfcA